MRETDIKFCIVGDEVRRDSLTKLLVGEIHPLNAYNGVTVYKCPIYTNKGRITLFIWNIDNMEDELISLNTRVVIHLTDPNIRENIKLFSRDPHTVNIVPSEPFDPKDRNDLLESILSAVDEDIRLEIKGTLSQRMTEIVKGLNEIIDEISELEL